MAISISTQTFARHNREILTTAEDENAENGPFTNSNLTLQNRKYRENIILLEAIASLVVTISLTHSVSQSVSQSGFLKYAFYSNLQEP